LTFEEIYRAHYEFIWLTLRHMGISERDTHDACQKVFLIAYRKQSDFEGRSALKTWLCGIALRVASDHRRSATARREVLVDEASLEGCAEPEQQQELEQRERLVELDSVLAQMPLEQRTVLVLFELQEMSGEEIAALVGVPEGTVRSRLRLARQAFSRIVSANRGTPVRVAVGGDP
jgi:RNA polymerase sigma-70 factor (ECF subfamily)